MDQYIPDPIPKESVTSGDPGSVPTEETSHQSAMLKTLYALSGEQATEARGDDQPAGAGPFASARKRPDSFFAMIPGDRYDDVAIVQVAHVFPGRDEYVAALKKRGELALLVLKGNSDNPWADEALAGVEHFQLEKDECQNANALAHCFHTSLAPHKRLVLLDHEGRFAETLAELHTVFHGRILGVIEHTERGLEKYEREQARLANSGGLPVPVVSIAGCRLHSEIELIIGAFVVSATRRILSSHFVALHDVQSLVLGYGRVGQAIVEQLPPGKVQVFDSTALAKVAAARRYLQLVSEEDRTKALGEADVIFCTGGKNGLKEEDYTTLKHGCFLAVVTSRGEALQMPPPSYTFRGEHANSYAYTHETTGHTVNLLNDGNAVNLFEQRSSAISSLQAVQGLELRVLAALCAGALAPGLQTPSLELQNQVAEAWLAWNERRR